MWKKLAMGVAAAALLTVSGQAMAKPGGIIVDDIDGCEVDEVNLHPNEGEVRVWVNHNTSNRNGGTIYWTLVDNGKPENGCVEALDEDACGLTDYTHYDIVLPDVTLKAKGKPQSVTLEVYVDIDCLDNLGRDSFRVE